MCKSEPRFKDVHLNRKKEDNKCDHGKDTINLYKEAEKQA